MPNQQESYTTLNPGASGDNVRDYTVQRPDGTSVKIQAVNLADAYFLAGTQSVTAAGEGEVRSMAMVELFERILNRLDRIAIAIEQIAHFEGPFTLGALDGPIADLDYDTSSNITTTQ